MSFNFVVDEENIGNRVDAFVANKCEKISRSLAQKLIKEGKILVDDKETKVSSKLMLNQVVTIPEEIESEIPENLIAEDLPIEIIYEDEDIIVVNKPKDMVVHPAIGNSTGTLVNAVLGKHELSDVNGDFRPGIIHRLDKNTTGALVIAKNNYAHQNIADQIKNRTTKKIYIALVRGLIKENNGVINMPIGRHPTDRKKMAVVKNGKEALTNFKVLKRYVYDEKNTNNTVNGYTLVEIELKTGRTHQIRVHMSQIGYPVVGDDVYSSGKNPFGVTSQMLHAHVLGFTHPTKNEWVEYKAPIPNYFEKIIKNLKELKVEEKD